ncbi:MAG: hypothetical protein E7020_06940 [Alphaproteobacteria bacterium]|nr:hypothetical protein [Alphaproteobacteria bacterium]
MPKNNIKYLPFWETIGRSFKYVLKNRILLKAIIPVVGFLAVIQIVCGMPSMCAFSASYCNQGFSFIGTITLIIAAAGIIINYCRSIICKAEIDYLSKNFWRRMGWYLLASISLAIIISIPTFATIVLISLLNLGDLPTSILSIMSLIGISIVFAPLFLVFPAVAVEDYTIINWSKLYNMVKGNFNAVFWGQFVIMMPYWIVFRMFAEIYKLIAIDNYIINLLFVIIILIIGMLDACFKGAYFAHIYQFFKFYNKK